MVIVQIIWLVLQLYGLGISSLLGWKVNGLCLCYRSVRLATGGEGMYASKISALLDRPFRLELAVNHSLMHIYCIVVSRRALRLFLFRFISMHLPRRGVHWVSVSRWSSITRILEGECWLASWSLRRWIVSQIKKFFKDIVVSNNTLSEKPPLSQCGSPRNHHGLVSGQWFGLPPITYEWSFST